MDLLKLISGIVLSLIGGKGTWWIVAVIFGGAVMGNWLQVIAGGIIGYFAFGLCVVALIAGVCLIFQGLFE